MKLFISFLLLTLSGIASAKSNYIFTCKGKDLEFGVKRTLKYYHNSANAPGWKTYWGEVDYRVGHKSGTLDADISWRNDPRPSYNVLNIALLEKDEAKLRKMGIEGGQVGFGSIDSREKITKKFKAKWSVYKTPQEVKELYIDDTALDCEIQN